MIPLYTNQLQEDLRERLHDLHILDSITHAEAGRLDKCFKKGLILVTYDGHIPMRAPTYCIATSKASWKTILQTLKHLA